MSRNVLVRHTSDCRVVQYSRLVEWAIVITVLINTPVSSVDWRVHVQACWPFSRREDAKMKDPLWLTGAVMFVVAAASCAGATQAVAGEVMIGDRAPEFSVLDETGALWNSADHVGKKIIVVYFYPADMTGGCTRQACAFRDDLSSLQGKGVEVVGVSGDSVANHQLFRKAHKLNFTLLADTEGKVAEAFGVPISKGKKTVTVEIGGEKELLTRTVTARRWTFVIGLDGRIVARNTMVKAAEDSQSVARIVEELANR